MLNRYSLALLLNLIFQHIVFGQDKLLINLAPDSAISKFKIRQITELGFGTIEESKPSWSTIESYDTLGRISQRISNNHGYHRCVYDFSYKKNKTKIIQKFYDFNPHQYKNDTAVTKTVLVFEKTRVDKYTGSDPFRNFKTILTMDSIGRVIETKDTIKCGYIICRHSYNDNGQLSEIKRFDSIHSDKPQLFAIDSISYDIGGRIIKKAGYFGFRENDSIQKHDREEITTFQYNEQGLLKESLKTSIYLLLENPKPGYHLYRYEYSFF